MRSWRHICSGQWLASLFPTLIDLRSLAFHIENLSYISFGLKTICSFSSYESFLLPSHRWIYLPSPQFYVVLFLKVAKVRFGLTLYPTWNRREIVGRCLEEGGPWQTPGQQYSQPARQGSFVGVYIIREISYFSFPSRLLHWDFA